MKTGNPEDPKVSIIVTDAGPLVTLAVAEALDTLLLPDYWTPRLAPTARN